MTADDVDLIADVLNEALAPFVADVKGLHAAISGWEAKWSDVGAMRERIAVLDSQTQELRAKTIDVEVDAEVTTHALSLLSERVAVVEVLTPVPGPPGPQGEKGEKGEAGLSLKGERGEKGEAGLSIKGERGEKGEAGLSIKGDLGERGEKGEAGLSVKGEPGPRGESGPIGARGEKGDAGLSIKGDPGERGEKGDPGLSTKGDSGARGEAGTDGIGLTDALINRDGHLIVTLSDGRTKDVGVIVGTDGVAGLNGKDVDPLFVQDFLSKELAKWPKPQDGKAGADGLSPHDFDWDFNPETRELSFTFSRDGKVMAQRTKYLRGMRIYRGVYESGRTYEEGDVATWDGSEYTALVQTKDRPGNGTSWKLTVKHGEKGARGPDGKPGRDGRDLTQMMTDGRKY